MVWSFPTEGVRSPAKSCGENGAGSTPDEEGGLKSSSAQSQPALTGPVGKT
jgi:hypothetical protein